MVQNTFAQHSHVEFKENKGQWESNILYKAKLPAGQLYLEQNKLTYQFYNETDIIRIGDLHHGWIKNPQASDSIINLHAFEVAFVNALAAQTKAQHPCSDYENYFIGNDSSKWVSNVKKYQDVTYQKLYAGIDLKFYSADDNNLKYDFIVAPNADPNQIQLQYNGINSIVLEKGSLVIETSVNKLVEQKPYAYQIINGKQKEVKCNFKLTNHVLSFDFPKGYNKTVPLIIDPALIFASYSGSTTDNWGYTSTFDEDGNLYGGGVAFGIGYPTTIGAFQIVYNGGYTDVSITKFNPYGTNLIYSTYIGGVSNDYPHSLVVNHNNELLVFGTTKSINFPMVVGGYDISQNGGYDIFVAKLNPMGTSLMSATYVGGTADDGQNRGNPLKYNYADDYRGEIIIDENNNVFVASTTYSNNFPTTPGVFNPSFLPGDMNQNACIFKLSPNLSTLMWSSYFGGNMDDAAYSLQFDELGNILFTGGTKSPDLPVTPTAIKQTLGGVMDGYITKITPDASTILACTYIGTDTLDQTFFVQLDTGNNVYVIGQTVGQYPITPATVYQDTNSMQFIHKLTPNLDATVFSTVFGSGSGHVDISLSAFLVNECNYILISGWGGNLNSFFGFSPFSTTNGLPVTSNAEQSTTDGQDYYLAMFGENADTLMYATYFGGNNSRDHVDGGTSRFDKKGMVYQAVCASCGGPSAGNDFPTTPGAWSNTSNSSNCNMGVFKLDLTKLTAIADVYTTPYYCVGETVHFQNLSIGGYSYLWDFGDGNTSNDFEPFHVYYTAGTYHIMLAVLDSVSCIQVDTDYVYVFIAPLPHFQIDTVPGICLGDSAQLQVIGGDTIKWLTTTNISDTTIANPFVWPTVSSTYSVYVIGECGTDTLTAYVEVFQPNINILPDDTICRGQSLELAAYGGKGYLWSPNATLDIDTIPNPTATPYYATTYNVEITDINECVWDTFMTVSVDTVLAEANVSDSVTICFGDSISISVSGGDAYVWSPANFTENSTSSNPVVFPIQTTPFIVNSSNSCSVATDTVWVTVLKINAQIVDDTLVCPGEQANLWATGGHSYWWEPSTLVSNPSSNVIHPIIYVPTLFTVTVSDITNCSLQLSVLVDTLPAPILILDELIETAWSNEIQLTPTTNAASFLWEPSLGLSCTRCLTPVVSSSTSTMYSLTVTSIDGCKLTKWVEIKFDGILHVPNAFTPNGDGDNDIFYAYGKDIAEFEMMIFDRWGEKLFTSDNLDDGWDGTYKGDLAKTETYVWKIKYKDVLGNPGELIGTVTLLR